MRNAAKWISRETREWQVQRLCSKVYSTFCITSVLCVYSYSAFFCLPPICPSRYMRARICVMRSAPLLCVRAKAWKSRQRPVICRSDRLRSRINTGIIPIGVKYFYTAREREKETPIVQEFIRIYSHFPSVTAQCSCKRLASWSQWKSFYLHELR